jgi:hypothetical protein
MPKRKLRLVRFSRPLTAVCEYCNQTFQSQNESDEMAECKIEAEFDAHKCKPMDSSQNALRIVREATENK